MSIKSLKRLLLVLVIFGALATGIYALINGVGQNIDTLTPEQVQQEQQERFALAEAETLFVAKKYDSAMRAFKGVISDYREGYYADKAQLRIGDCFLEKNDYRMARTAYALFISNNPSSPHIADAYYRFGDSFIKSGEQENALNAYIFAFNNYPEHSLGEKTLFWIANWYFDAKDFDEATYYYRKLVAWFPDHAFTDQGLYQLARINLYQNKPKQVRKYARRLLKDFPVSSLVPDAYIIMSKTYTHPTEYVRKEELLREALKRRPLDRLVYKRLADMYNTLRLWKQAIELYEIAIRPIYSDPYKRADFRDTDAAHIVAAAVPMVDSAFFADTLIQQCYFERFVCLLAQGDSLAFNNAAKLYVRYAHNQPLQNRTNGILADIQYGKKDFAEAIKVYDRVAPDTLLEPQQLFRKAMCYTQLHAYDQSIPIYRKVVKQLVGAPAIVTRTIPADVLYLALAEALYNAQKMDDAVIAYRLIKGLDSDYVSLKIAQCYNSMSMRSEAGTVLEKIALRYPHKYFTMSDTVAYTDSVWQRSYLVYLNKVIGSTPF